MVATAAKGMFAVGAIQLASNIPAGGVPVIEYGKLLIQAIVALGTLYHMYKQRKSNQPPNA